MSRIGRAPNLRIVTDPLSLAPEGARRPKSKTNPETMLAALVPELIAAEQLAARLQGHVTAWRQLLAKQRGVAFIREEHVRAEFGE